MSGWLYGNDLKKALMELPDRVFKRVLVGSARRSVDIVLMKARQKVPIETLQLSKSLGIKTKIYKKTKAVVAMIGARSMKDPITGRNPANYAHLVEGGHLIRNKKGGASLGYVEGEPFLEPALDESAQAVLGKLADELRRGIEREAAKVGRKKP